MRADSVAALLVDVIPLVMRTIRKEIRAQRDSSLAVPQMRTLAFLDGTPGATLSDVAEHVGLSLPSMSKIVDTLVERRLLARQPNPADRRRVALTLTEDGRNILQAARLQTQEKLAERLKHLSSEELKTISRAMKILYLTFYIPKEHLSDR